MHVGIVSHSECLAKICAVLGLTIRAAHGVSGNNVVRSRRDRRNGLSISPEQLRHFCTLESNSKLYSFFSLVTSVLKGLL